MNDLHGHLISKASEVDQLRVDLAKMEVFLQFFFSCRNKVASPVNPL